MTRMNNILPSTIIGLVLFILCGLFLHLVAIGIGWAKLLVLGIVLVVGCFVFPYALLFPDNFMRYLDQIDRRFRR